MEFKKWRKVLLTGAAALALAACGSQKTDNKTANKADSGDKTKLVVGVDKIYSEYMKDIKDKFEKDNKITLEIKEVNQSDVLTNLPTDGPTGSAPDVMMAPYDRVGGLGQQGHLAEVKLENADQYDDKMKSMVTLDGKVYGQPNVIETLVLYYNKDLLKEAPKTFEDLEKLQKDPKYAFEGESGKSTGFLADWTNFYYSYGLSAGYGAYVFGKNGTDPKDIGLAAGDSEKALEYVKKWYDTWPQGMKDASKSGAFASEQFIGKKAAAIIDGPWKAASFKQAKVNYGATTIPTLPNGKTYSPFAGGKAWVISNYSKNKEGAQKFLVYITGEEAQKKFFDKTQEVPATKAGRKYADEKGTDLTKAIVKQFENSQPMPNIPEMAEVWNPGKAMYFDVASGKKDAKTAIKDAVEAIKSAIEQKFAK